VDVLVAGRLVGLVEGAGDAVDDEGEGRGALASPWLPWLVGEDEDRRRERRRIRPAGGFDLVLPLVDPIVTAPRLSGSAFGPAMSPSRDIPRSAKTALMLTSGSSAQAGRSSLPDRSLDGALGAEPHEAWVGCMVRLMIRSRSYSR
jgi:hypothetical protein